MVRHGCRASVKMAKLPMRPALTDLHKPKFFEDADDFAGFEYGQSSQVSPHGNRVCADEFAFDGEVAVFEQHLDHFLEIGVEFVEGFALGMGTGDAGDVADIEAGLRIFFDDGGVLMCHRVGL